MRTELLSLWRRWRVAVFATCTVWLVIQNALLVAVFLMGGPRPALAAGGAVARAAVQAAAPFVILSLASVLGLALTAWLVVAPGRARELRSTWEGVRHEH